LWEPRQSGDWQSLHRVRWVSSGSVENHEVPWLIHIAKAEDWRQHHWTGLTGRSDRFDRCATT
jgi:hypothetical protein